jgi:hypothetical protein
MLQGLDYAMALRSFNLNALYTVCFNILSMIGHVILLCSAVSEASKNESFSCVDELCCQGSHASVGFVLNYSVKCVISKLLLKMGVLYLSCYLYWFCEN